MVKIIRYPKNFNSKGKIQRAVKIYSTRIKYVLKLQVKSEKRRRQRQNSISSFRKLSKNEMQQPRNYKKKVFKKT